jgi:DNA-directed RNA polymerase subunit RPC12/RpoP
MPRIEDVKCPNPDCGKRELVKESFGWGKRLLYIQETPGPVGPQISYRCKACGEVLQDQSSDWKPLGLVVEYRDGVFCWSEQEDAWESIELF